MDMATTRSPNTLNKTYQEFRDPNGKIGIDKEMYRIIKGDKFAFSSPA